MSKDQFRKLIESLKNIEAKLDTLVRLQLANMPKPKITQAEKDILRFCDKKHTINDIAKETKKTPSNVKSILTRLRKKALIRSVKVKDKTVYERIA